MSTDGDIGRRGRGPTDPGRRARIADAAIAVVAERGVEGVTHRAVAALHRPSLRRAGTAWDDTLVELFASRTDPITGKALAATFCGLLMQALLADPPPTRDEVDALFRRGRYGLKSAALGPMMIRSPSASVRMTARSFGFEIEMHPAVGVLPPMWKKMAEPWPSTTLGRL
ncbi:MAG TPA: hypothetical protein VGP70_04840 [Actinomadura sp.]|nr:hypothetical protein [Actinomadura sp.]